LQRLQGFISGLASQRRPYVWAAAALLLTLPSLWIGFVTDDHVFRLIFERMPSLPELKIPLLDTFSFGRGEPEYNTQLMERGVVPWWTDPSWQLAFWRPLASMTHWVDHQLFRQWAWPMHLHSMFLYALLVFFAAKMYERDLRGTWLAGLAGFFYAVDSSHALPVGWLANRNAILAALFGVLVLICHDSWRVKKRRGSGVAAWLFLVLALLCGEGSIAVCGYLFAYACFMDKGSRRSRAVSLSPYVITVAVWRVAYSSLGYGAVGSGLYTDPGHDPGTFLVSLVQYLPMLIYSQFVGPEPILWSFMPSPWNGIYFVAVLAALSVIVWVVMPSIRSDRVARYYALGMVLSAVPSCATIPQYRLMMYTGLGAAGLLAIVATRTRAHISDAALSTNFRRSAIAFLVFLHAVAAPVMFPVSLIGLRMLGKAFDRTNESLPSGPGVVDETIIIVSTTGDLTYAIPPAMRSSLGQPMPKNLWPLYSGVDDVVVTRDTETSLLLRVDEGWLRRPWAMLFRDTRTKPIPKGYMVTLSDMVVTVRETNGDGYPSVVHFQFDQPLEEKNLHWFTWGGGYFVPFQIPAIGTSTTLPGVGIRGIIQEILGSLR
jgi:hypothetical protein